MNTLNETVATNDSKLTLQDVQNKIEELVKKAKESKNGEEQSLEFNQTLEELIKLRAKLMVAYGPVINLIEQIETEVKNLDPAAGKYGSSSKRSGTPCSCGRSFTVLKSEAASVGSRLFATEARWSESVPPVIAETDTENVPDSIRKNELVAVPPSGLFAESDTYLRLMFHPR